MDQIQAAIKTDTRRQLAALLREQKRRRGLTDLHFFCKNILGYTDLTDADKFHGEYCRHLENPKRRFKLTLTPRGSLKSSIGTMGGSLQDLVKNPNIRILLASEKFTISTKYLEEIKGHIEDNEVFRELYGDLVGKKVWSASEITINTRTRRRASPTIACAGIDVTKVGMHYDIIRVDDPHSDQNTTNQDQIDKVIRWYRLLLSLLDPGGYLYITGTIWHYGDLYNYIINKERERLEQGLNKRFIIFKRDSFTGTTSDLMEGRVTKDKLLWPQRLSAGYLKNQYIEQGPYIFSCNPANTKILMADWTEKNIEDIKVGDSVVGWSIGQRLKLQSSKVLSIGNRLEKVVKIKMQSGREIRCTRKHKWFLDPVGRSRNGPWDLQLYGEAKLGRKLMYLGRMIDYNKKDKWLAGIYDGEGSCSTMIQIAQSEKHNPEVCKEIEKRLTKHGFDYSRTTEVYRIKGGLLERARFLNLTRPVRNNKIINSLWAKNFISEKDLPISIKKYGVEQVYALHTETGNYVAHGYLSKNCQYRLNPIDDENAIFKRSWLKTYHPKDLPKNISVYSTIDPMRDEEGKDYLSIVTGGMDENWLFHIMDIRRLKADEHDTVDEMFDVYQKYKPLKMGFESVAWQKTFLKYVKMLQLMKGRRLPIVELKTDTKVTKRMRIKSMVPYFKAGLYLIPAKRDLDSLTGNMAVLVDELTRYPKVTNDDCADALAYMNQLTGRPGVIHVLSKINPKSFMAIRAKLKRPVNRLGIYNIRRTAYGN